MSRSLLLRFPPQFPAGLLPDANHLLELLGQGLLFFLPVALGADIRFAAQGMGLLLRAQPTGLSLAAPVLARVAHRRSPPSFSMGRLLCLSIYAYPLI
jgi:hypothetical protein